MIDSILNFLETTGLYAMFTGPSWWKYLIMYIIIGTLFYLAVWRKYEPLLLLPIAFGMLLANLPGAELLHLEYFIVDQPDYGNILVHGGLLDILYIGVKVGLYPSLIFMGVGAMTDFYAADSQPKKSAARCGGSAWDLRRLYRCADTGLHTGGRRLHWYNRRSRRTDRHPCGQDAGPDAARSDCDRCVFLYGADPDHPGRPS